MKKALIPLAVLGVCIGCQSQSGTQTADNSPAATPPASTTATPPAGQAAGGSQFAQVSDILNKNCVGCHGAQRAPAEIHLASYDGIMKGGEKGPVVKAGDPKGSVLVQALHGENGMRKMPPRGPGLSPDQIKVIEDWIQAGAKQS